MSTQMSTAGGSEMFSYSTALRGIALSMLMVATMASAAEFKSGEVIVKYKDGSFRTRTTMNSLYDAAGVETVQRYSELMGGMEHLLLKENVKVQDAIAELMRNDNVEYAQPNYIMHIYPVFEESSAAANPSNDRSANDWQLPCIYPGVHFPPNCKDWSFPSPPPKKNEPNGSRPELATAPVEVNPPVEDPDLSRAYGLEITGATRAWKIHRGDKKFLIADIDTGVDYNHEDLAGNIWRNPNPSEKKDVVGYDFIHEDGLPFDDQSHGTHTAGTIAAVGGNGIGISGIIPKVSLMSVKFLDKQGSGTTANAIRAIDYAVEHGAKILSNSWGGPGDENNDAMKEAIVRAQAKGVLFIAAAGNGDAFGRGIDNDSSNQKDYPASFDVDNIISVAATDNNDQLTSFSNYGKTSVHLAAPGLKVYSTLPGNKYKAESGTSMSCPHVAGAAALVWSMHPNWNYKQVKKALLNSVDKLPSLDGKVISGGRLNVEKALRMTLTSMD